MTDHTPAPSPDPGTTNNPDAPGDLPVDPEGNPVDNEEDDDEENAE